MSGSGKRGFLVYGGLAVLAFVASLAYQLQQRGVIEAWQADAADAQPTHERHAAAAAEAGQRTPQRRQGNVAGQESASGGWPDDAAFAEEAEDRSAREREEQALHVSEAARIAVSALDPAQRGEALGRLANAPEATPEVIQALELAATRDLEARNRTRAVVALGRVARRMPDRSQALFILERAAQDANGAVAALARRSLQDLATSPPAQPAAGG